MMIMMLIPIYIDNANSQTTAAETTIIIAVHQNSSTHYIIRIYLVTFIQLATKLKIISHLIFSFIEY